MLLKGEKMKKLISIFISVLFLLSLTACVDKNKVSGLYIEKAQLTEQEENIAKLLGLNDSQRIYDFKVDDTIKSVQINTYELKDGEWKIISGGGGNAFEDTEGRIALTFDNIAEGLRVAWQSEHEGGSNSYATELTEELKNMGRATSIMTERKEIIYEKEIPLAIQISTTKNEINSYNVEYFEKPEEYQKNSYEHVYAITIRFSQKTVNELSASEENPL